MKSKTALNLTKSLQFFSDQNRGRRTRLGVYLGQPGEMADYWLEDGLPLAAIQVGALGPEGPEIDIVLGDRTGETSHFTHRIGGAKSVRITLSMNGETDGIEVDNGLGENTVLRFEPMLEPRAI